MKRRIQRLTAKRDEIQARPIPGKVVTLPSPIGDGQQPQIRDLQNSQDRDKEAINQLLTKLNRALTGLQPKDKTA